MLSQYYCFDSNLRNNRLRQLLQSLVACDPGRILRALAGGMVRRHFGDMQRNAPGCALLPAVRFKISSSNLQAMVDVKGDHLARKSLRACPQQRG
ncbi:hypothetical protein D3C71_1475590 [compost metagenome]